MRPPRTYDVATCPKRQNTTLAHLLRDSSFDPQFCLSWSEDAKEAEVCEKEVENDNDILKIQLKVESTQQTGEPVLYAPTAHGHERRTKTNTMSGR